MAGVLDRAPFCQSYRQAFRTVNRLYVELRVAHKDTLRLGPLVPVR